MTKASNQQWIILFGGAGRQQVVLTLFNAGIDICCVIIPKRRSDALDKSITTIRKLGICIKETNKSDVEKTLHPHKGSAILSVGFPFIIPSTVLNKHDLCLNIHPTLLPKYRGPTTGPYILHRDEPYSGSTVHILDEGMDTGDVVVQSKVDLTKFDTVRSMQRRVYESEPDLIIEALAFLDAGKKPVKQNEKEASIFPHKRTPEDSRINPSKPLLNLIDEIRACDPDSYPAFFMLQGQKVCIKLWRPSRPDNEQDKL